MPSLHSEFLWNLASLHQEQQTHFRCMASNTGLSHGSSMVIQELPIQNQDARLTQEKDMMFGMAAGTWL